MPNNIPPNEPNNNALAENDPQHIWKNQTTEAFKMSADQLRHKAEQHQSKSRIEATYSIIVGLGLFGFFAWNFARIHELLPRLGAAVLSLWAIYYAYQAYKWFWQKRLAPDASVSTTLQSYRSELEKRRDYGRNLWRRAGLPFVLLGATLAILPKLITSLSAPGKLASSVLAAWMPLFLLFAVWLVVFFFVRKRRRDQLQREIDELRSFENASRS